MADKKITGLPAATLPILTGVKFEAVQGGINVQVDADDMPGSGAAGVTSVTGTTNRVTSTGGATPVIDIDAAYDAAVQAIANAKVADAINNGTTTIAPSQNAVFDALALKANLTDVIGVQDLFIPASAFWPRVTGGCGVLTQYEMATSLFNVQGLPFDQTTQEFAQFQIRLPRKYNNGTVTVAPYWTAQSGAGTVQWGISGRAYSNDDALTVALGSEQTSDDTLIATNDLHIGPTTAAITLAGTPADADFLAIQISRNPGSDTLTGDAILLGIAVFITTDAAIDA